MGRSSEDVKPGSLEIYGKSHLFEPSVSNMFDTGSSGQLRIGCLNACPISIFLSESLCSLIVAAGYDLSGFIIVIQATALFCRPCGAMVFESTVGAGFG